MGCCFKVCAYCSIMSETMLTYRLPNGTHVLIHQATLVNEKGAEGVPVLLFEEGHTEQSVIEENSERSLFMPEVQVIGNGEQISTETQVVPEKVTEQALVASPTLTEKVQLNENQILDHLDDFAEMVMWYKCRMCTFTASQKQDLLDHLKMQHVEPKTASNTSAAAAIPVENDINKEANAADTGSKEEQVSERLVFLCGQCTCGFSSLHACKQHMMQDHDLIVQEEEEEQQPQLKDPTPVDMSEPGISEPEKQSEVTSETSQQENILNRKKSATLKCPVRGCQYKLSSEQAVEIHKTCHIPDNPRDFKCSECQVPFERWRSCALHLWKMHSIDAGLLICPVCDVYRTATSMSLDNHMRIHGDIRAFKCPECGKRFKQAAQLRNHRVMHLDRKAADLPRWYAAKRCDICYKSYADSKCLKKHIQAVHSKLRPYVCQVCGHASARKAMLQMHLRQHTGEKPHSCPLCEYRTGDHNSLRRHVMRHTGQRPYRCPHCPYSAIQSSSYKNHLRSKHPGQSGMFNCSQCTFKTVSQESFLLHVSDHKNGVITSSTPSEGGNGIEEVFPGNVAAAHLIYRCLNALSTEGNTLEANVTGSSTSADGTTQTITIQIPSKRSNTEQEEDETTRCFLEIQQPEEEEEVDTGGITIPAEPEQNIVCHVAT